MIKPNLAVMLHTLTSTISYAAIQHLAATQDDEQFHDILNLCINGLIHDRDRHRAGDKIVAKPEKKSASTRPSWLKVIK